MEAIVEAHLRVLHKPLRIGEAIPKAGEYWQGHLPTDVTKHLSYISSFPKAESFLVWTPPEKLRTISKGRYNVNH